MQFIFGFVPQCGFGQCPLHALVHVSTGELLKQTHAKSDVVVDGHRERRRFLEHHAHFRTQQGDILRVGQDVVAIEQNFTFRTLFGYSSNILLKVRSSVDLPQPDGPINAVTRFWRYPVDVFQGMEFAVVEVQITNLNFTRGSFNHTHCNLFLIVPDALRESGLP